MCKTSSVTGAIGLSKLVYLRYKHTKYTYILVYQQLHIYSYMFQATVYCAFDQSPNHELYLSVVKHDTITDSVIIFTISSDTGHPRSSYQQVTHNTM